MPGICLRLRTHQLSHRVLTLVLALVGHLGRRFKVFVVGLYSISSAVVGLGVYFVAKARLIGARAEYRDTANLYSAVMCSKKCSLRLKSLSLAKQLNYHSLPNTSGTGRTIRCLDRTARCTVVLLAWNRAHCFVARILTPRSSRQALPSPIVAEKAVRDGGNTPHSFIAAPIFNSAFYRSLVEDCQPAPNCTEPFCGALIFKMAAANRQGKMVSINT